MPPHTEPDAFRHGARGHAGPVDRDLIDVLRRTLHRDPTQRPTIPQLKSHPWLVPARYQLDPYNVLVLVSSASFARVFRVWCGGGGVDEVHADA
eukprot:3073845-Rhodomonas_salina.2